MILLCKPWYRKFEEWFNYLKVHFIFFFSNKKKNNVYKHELYCIVECFSVYILRGIIDWVKTKRWIFSETSQNNSILKCMRYNCNEKVQIVWFNICFIQLVQWCLYSFDMSGNIDIILTCWIKQIKNHTILCAILRYHVRY